MEIKFKPILLLSILTTLIALLASFAALPNDSGYAGLFFIAISPIFIVVFIFWTLILLSLINRRAIFRKLWITILSTIIFEYFVAIVAMWLMSDDGPDDKLGVFLSDCADLFGNKEVLFCILIVAIIYALSLKYIIKTFKKQPDIQQRSV